MLLPILLFLNFLYKLKFLKLSEEAVKHFSINEVTTFLVAYQAIRTLSEAVFESFPQTIFQTYMVLNCQQTDCGMNLGEEGEQSLQAIVQSLTISIFNIIMHTGQARSALRLPNHISPFLGGILKSMVWPRYR